MTNGELVAAVCVEAQPIRISLSKEGTFLTVGDANAVEISDEQADLLWELLPQIASLSPDDRAKLRAEHT